MGTNHSKSTSKPPQDRRAKYLSFASLLFFMNLLFFNNCSKNYVRTSQSITGQGDLGSTTNPVAPALPHAISPINPLQPAPAPIEPITMTNKPAWMAGKSLYEWIEIPNTSGAGGASIDAFSGLAFREATSEIIIGAAGGHGDGTDNRVVSLVLESDQPKWILHIGPSKVPEYDVSHYADGTPSARHTYQNTYYVEPLHRLFLVGARFVAGGKTMQYNDVDAFSFETNQWDPPNTWAPVPGCYGSLKIPSTQDIYTQCLNKWSADTALKSYLAGNPSSNSAWSNPITNRTDTAIRWPLAYDSKRNQIFSLQFGDGQGYDLPTINSSRVDLATGVQSKVTINPSPALTQFISDVPVYASMDYDPENDQFLFYDGRDSAAGRVFVIKPNSTSNNYDMTLLQVVATSTKPTATTPAGLNSNFKYVPRLKGFILLPRGSSNLFFLKTAQ